MSSNVPLLMMLSLVACAVDELEVETTSQPMIGQVITPPTSAMKRPERVYVLPVVYVPAATDVTDPTVYANGIENLRIELRTAREKYREMLRRPGPPTQVPSRGTFELATWDSGANTARVFDETTN